MWKWIEIWKILVQHPEFLISLEHFNFYKLMNLKNLENFLVFWSSIWLFFSLFLPISKHYILPMLCGFFFELFVIFMANMLFYHPFLILILCLPPFKWIDTVFAGSPSGHAMGSSCVWYVMITAALSHTVSRMDKSSTTLHRSALRQLL